MFLHASPATTLRRIWAQLNNHVDQLSHGLRRLGIARGDHVGIWSPSGNERLRRQSTRKATSLETNQTSHHHESERTATLRAVVK